MKSFLRKKWYEKKVTEKRIICKQNKVREMSGVWRTGPRYFVSECKHSNSSGNLSPGDKR